MSLSVDPYWPNHWANLSLLKWYSGDREDAIDAMKKAAELAPRYALYWVNLGWMQEACGDLADATHSYQIALEKNIWLQMSPFYKTSFLRNDVLTRYQAENDVSRCPSCEAYILYKAGELDLAKNILLERLTSRMDDADAQAVMGLIAQEIGDESLAWQQVQTALLMKQIPRVLGWAAHVARVQTKDDLAIEYLEIAWDQLAQGSSLEGYYTGIYHRLALPKDHPPQFFIPPVTSELVSGFEWLMTR